MEILFLVAWIFSPFALIPMLLVINSKNNKNKKEIELLKSQLSVKQNIIDDYKYKYGDIRLDEGDLDAVPTQNTIPVQDTASTQNTIPVQSTASLQDNIPVQSAVPTQNTIPVQSAAPTQNTIPVQSATSSQNTAVRVSRTRPSATADAGSRANRQPQRKPVAVKEKKRFTSGQILFGVGVLCISIAGIIFATTTWSILPDVFKLMMLIMASLFCYGVSYILKNKLNLRDSSIAFFVMGSIFLPLSIVAVGYFEWFGQWFSFKGDGRYLIGSICFLLMTISLMMGRKFYEIEILKVVAFVSANIAALYLVKQIVGRGDVVMIVFALYLLMVYMYINRGFFKGIIRDDLMSKVITYICLIYVAISTMTFVIYGISELMSVVLLINQIMLAAIAVIQGFGWLYYVIPVLGALFALNLSDAFTVTVPHGDTAAFIIITAIILFVYKLVRYKGKRVLDNLSTHIVALLEVVCVFIGTGVILLGFDNADFSECYGVAAAFVIATIVYGLIYIIDAYKIKSEDEAVTIVKTVIDYMIYGTALYAMAFFVCTAFDFTSDEVGTYFITLIPLSVTMISMVIIGVIYFIQMRSDTFSRRVCITERLIMIYANVCIVFSFLASCAVDRKERIATGAVLLVIMIIVQLYSYFKRNNLEGVVTAFFIPITISMLIDDIGYVKYGVKDEVEAGFVLLVGLVVCAVIMAIGLAAYKKLIVVNEEKGQMLFDWNLLMAGILIVDLAATGYRADNSELIMCVALAVLCLYVSRKLNAENRRWTYLGTTVFMCLAWWVQEFFAWPMSWKSELTLIVLLPVALLLYYVLFKDSRRVISWVNYGLIGVFILAQWIGMDLGYSDEVENLFKLKLFLFFGTLLISFLVMIYLKKLRYSILTALIILMTTYVIIDRWYAVSALVLAVISIGYIVYQRKNKRDILSVAPLVTILSLYGELVAYHMFDDVAIDFGDNIICILWIVMFAVLMAVGRFLYKQVISRNEDSWLSVDWYTVLSIVPIIAVCDYGNDKLEWCGIFMLALYFIAYYKRINPIVSKIAITAASIVLAICWWTEPFVDISERFADEWRIIGFLLLVYTLTKRIFRTELDKAIDFMYWASVISIVWQSISAISSADVFDVIVLGLVVLAMVVISYMIKSRKWFLLASITMVILVLYMSRGFFKLIAWWVYLLFAGVVLIGLAVSSEFLKKNVDVKTKVRTMFDGWNE